MKSAINQSATKYFSSLCTRKNIWTVDFQLQPSSATPSHSGSARLGLGSPLFFHLCFQISHDISQQGCATHVHGHGCEDQQKEMCTSTIVYICTPLVLIMYCTSYVYYSTGTDKRDDRGNRFSYSIWICCASDHTWREMISDLIEKKMRWIERGAFSAAAGLSALNLWTKKKSESQLNYPLARLSTFSLFSLVGFFIFIILFLFYFNSPFSPRLRVRGSPRVIFAWTRRTCVFLYRFCSNYPKKKGG